MAVRWPRCQGTQRVVPAGRKPKEWQQAWLRALHLCLQRQDRPPAGWVFRYRQNPLHYHRRRLRRTPRQGPNPPPQRVAALSQLQPQFLRCRQDWNLFRAPNHLHPCPRPHLSQVGCQGQIPLAFGENR